MHRVNRILSLWMNLIWISKKYTRSCGRSVNLSVRTTFSGALSPDDSLTCLHSTDVQTFVLVHLVTKFGTAANDAATSLKLLEKGLRKEDLAVAVLIDFPFQIVFGYLAAKWSQGEKPLKPVCDFDLSLCPCVTDSFGIWRTVDDSHVD